MTRHLSCRVGTDLGPPWRHPRYDGSLDAALGICAGLKYGALILLWLLAALVVVRLLI